MKNRIRILTLVLFLVILFSYTFAWYNNNREVSILGGQGQAVSSIKIQSNGIMQVGFAVDDELETISHTDVSFSNALSMLLNKHGYEDVTGVGLLGKMYSPSLESNGQPTTDSSLWEVASVDNAANSDDSGQYVVADIYFQSDEKMDIYLLESSSIEPVSEGNDLVNKKDPKTNIDYKEFHLFSDFVGGIPNININQSSYGLFSRNLIAGATRVAFSEFDFSKGSFPIAPNMIWVPNSQYQLTIPENNGYVYSFNQNGTKESSYSYYTKLNLDTDYEKNTVYRDADTGTIIDELYRKSMSGYDRVDNVILYQGKTIPSVIVQGNIALPAIWDSDMEKYISAAFVTDSNGDTFLASADYEENKYDDFAYSVSYEGEIIHVQKKNDIYEKVTLNSDKTMWVETGVVYSGTQLLQIENGMKKDGSEGYFETSWIDDSGFDNEIENRSCSVKKIGTTTQVGSGYYYTRVQIVIWVEGCDNEANIALNSGEFKVNLEFYGSLAQDEE